MMNRLPPEERRDYSVRVSSRARRVRVVVHRNGRVEVVVPRGFNRRRIPGLVAERRGWIDGIRAGQAAQRQSWDAAERGPWPRQLRLPLLEECWHVTYEPGPRGRCRKDGDDTLRVRAGDAGEAHTALDRWLGERARSLFGPWLERLAKAIEVDFSGFSVRGQRTRWGSCSGRGHISLNRRLLLLPEPLVEYVLVHELCHRRHLHHGPEFHALVARHLPDAARREAELRQAGRYLPPWLEE